MSQWSFFQSTLIIALLSPLGLFLAASFFLLVIPAGKWPPKRRLLLGLLTLLFAFSCTDFCGKKMLAFLEALTPEARGERRGRPAVVLVLGGGAVAEGQTYQPSVSSQRRLRKAREILSCCGDGKLLLSGIESPLMARWLRASLPREKVLLETRSLNTEGNLRESAVLLRRLYSDERSRPQVFLVTDRFHMARAWRWAKKFMPDFEVVPSPAPSLVRDAPWHPVNFVPTCRGLELTSMAWRETLALLRDWCRSHDEKQDQ
ncbi:YdcF family protein [Pyramidobacter piscolens]|uniref:DUF218 domain-containing protein n=1 Tax=Pyramidobacter piscolens W5455 TaxID=352165 RepID=A0ABP2HRS6_9BACT|nr:YdcF family protein [Pyramidobacter piscolens]EFB89962.1 hypothetical protein HMPREF7215_0502 [Pyramidobacter piscolens W5455]BDF78692.1 hypothetical protein CE91St28_14860 [Pyramidobacter piscolens]